MGKLQAILKAKCPKCHEGDMFKTGAYNLTQFHKMYDNCTNCGLKFEVEPGFFVGAMYVNYAFTIAIMVAVSITLNVFDSYNLQNFLIGIVGSIILLLPVLFRYSRILFLHLFGGVDFIGKADPS